MAWWHDKWLSVSHIYLCFIHQGRIIVWSLNQENVAHIDLTLSFFTQKLETATLVEGYKMSYIIDSNSLGC